MTEAPDKYTATAEVLAFRIQALMKNNIRNVMEVRNILRVALLEAEHNGFVEGVNRTRKMLNNLLTPQERAP